MGTPVVPGEKGDDCLLIYPAGETPKYLLAAFTGIGKCPAWGEAGPNGEHILTQDLIVPCLWEKRWDTNLVRYIVQAGQSILRLHYGGHERFYGRTFITGSENFTNVWECPPASGIYPGGTGYVDLFDFPGRAYQQAHDFGLMPVAYTRFDVFTCPNEPAYVSVRRFGNVRTPTNIAIKFDATHYDQWEMFEQED